MAYDWNVLFWIVCGAVMGPMVVVGCLVSIVKAFVDRRRIKRNRALRKRAKIEAEEGQPQLQQPEPPQAPSKRPNIMFIEDLERKNKWRDVNNSSTRRSSRRARPPGVNASDTSDSGSGSAVVVANGHDVRVTVEHNLRVPNGSGIQNVADLPRSLENGVENLGSSFSDVGDRGRSLSANDYNIEMNTLAADYSDSMGPATPKDSNSWHARAEEEESEADGPQRLTGRGSNTATTGANRLSSSSVGQVERRGRHVTPSSNFYIPSYQHKHDRLQNHSNHDPNTLSAGSLTANDPGRISPRAVKVFVTSRSEDYGDRTPSPLELSARRSSYSSALDIDIDAVDVFQKRSQSEDNLQGQLIHPAPPFQPPPAYATVIASRGLAAGEDNRGFDSSSEAQFIEM